MEAPSRIGVDVSKSFVTIRWPSGPRAAPTIHWDRDRRAILGTRDSKARWRYAVCGGCTLSEDMTFAGGPAPNWVS